MSARIVKFTFAREFKPTPGGAAGAIAPDESEREAEIARAQSDGFAAGHAAGVRESEAGHAARLASVMERLAFASERVLTALDAERRSLQDEALKIAVETGRALARSLIAREPEGEILQLCAAALAHVRGKPQLALRVAPDLAAAVEEGVARLAREHGFEGRVVTIGDPAQSLGDCRIEWAEGGMVREEAAIRAAIQDIVARFIASRAAGETE